MDNSNAAKTGKKAEASPANQRPRQKKMLAPLVAILALVLAGNSFYLTWSMYQQNASYASNIALLKAQQNDISAQMQAAAQNWTQTEQQLQNRIKSLSNNLHSALQQRLYQKQDWLLLKARHYLELAQVNLHWSDDSKASIALLQQADTLLGEIPDQRVFPVRQTIATDISRLQAMPVVDVAGLLSQLDAAQDLVSKLTVQSALVSPASQSTTPEASASPSAWRTKLRDNISVLEKLVVIHHHDEDIKPMLSPMLQNILRESIRMNLQEAQWAVLQNNSQVYQLSLQRALTQIKRNFDLSANSAQALIKNLQALQQQKLNAEKPVISDSLQQLNQIIDSGANGDKTP